MEPIQMGFGSYFFHFSGHMQNIYALNQSVFCSHTCFYCQLANRWVNPITFHVAFNQSTQAQEKMGKIPFSTAPKKLITRKLYRNKNQMLITLSNLSSPFVAHINYHYTTICFHRIWLPITSKTCHTSAFISHAHASMN